ncbi:hypothetical protein ACROYT_G016495 [Oculina patagonica]
MGNTARAVGPRWLPKALWLWQWQQSKVVFPNYVFTARGVKRIYTNKYRRPRLLKAPQINGELDKEES